MPDNPFFGIKTKEILLCMCKEICVVRMLINNIVNLISSSKKKGNHPDFFW